MGEGNSDNINYCMPVNIGVIAQDITSYDEVKLTAAVEIIMKQLKRWFGSFSVTNKTPSHNQLILMTPNKNQISGQIIRLLKDKYGAKLVYTDEESIKKYCWITIAAWDGMANQDSAIYKTIKDILSTADVPSEDYILRFPENRPVFQIVLPNEQDSLSEINYKVREIYPHLLETIRKSNDNKDDAPWFCRSHFIDQGWLEKRKDTKRRNFKANAKKIKQFNKKIVSFSKIADNETENIYDLLPWHHQDKKILPDYVDIANLREIYYDMISMRAQKKQNRQNFILMALVVIAMGCFSAYSDLIEIYWLLIGYLIFIIAAYLFYWLFVKGTNAHNRYLEFRALAEGMRVQCYWYAAGINESVGDNYTVKFQKDMFWATQAFKSWYVMDYLLKDNGDDTARLEDKQYIDYKPSNQYIKTEWLGTLLKKDENGNYVSDLPENCPPNPPEQLSFFTSRIAKFSEKDRISKRFTIGFTIFSILLSAILALLIWKFDFANENWFVFIISLFNILSLMVTTNNNLNAYDQLASKYSYCKLLAQKAVQDYAADENKAQKIFKQFGVEALEENAEWLMIKNDREPAVPNN